MESPKLLHSCRSNVYLYSQDSRPVWCLGEFHGKDISIGCTFSPFRSWVGSPRPRVLLAGSPRAEFVSRSTDSTATLGVRCSQHPQPPELAVTGITPSKCFTPQVCPPPALNTLCIMISSKETKFCLSSTGQAIQGLQKVSGVWTGEQSQNQQADGLSF